MSDRELIIPTFNKEMDVVTQCGVKKYADTGFDITVVDSVASTNTLLSEKASHGAKQGTVIIANEQTSGRGRHGHSFFSPRGTGLYMSVLLRPRACDCVRTAQITTIAAVAVCEAIEKVSDESATIKWVNDIFIGGKKVCGILTEAAVKAGETTPEYVVLGIGINVYEPEGGFPFEIADTAGAIFKSPRKGIKDRIAAEILNHFIKYYTSSNQSEYVSQYRQRSIAIGKEVAVISAEKRRNALVTDIDDECRLLVTYENGDTDCLSSGEISIKL